MTPIDDYRLTGEERNWMRRYEHHNRRRRVTPQERSRHSRKLAELRQELPGCPHAWVIIGLFRFRGVMSAEDVQEILHLLPQPPVQPEPVKPRKRIRALEMKPAQLVRVRMPKRRLRKLELFPDPPVQGPMPKPRRRMLKLD
jgi:hypothetical protein